MPEKRFGLLLNLGGAPNTPHVIPGLPGYYRPDVPTPVGGSGEYDLDAAKTAGKDASIPVDLVEIKAGDVQDAVDVTTRDLMEGTAGVAEARRGEPVGAEVEQIQDEQAALTAAKGA